MILLSSTIGSFLIDSFSIFFLMMLCFLFFGRVIFSFRQWNYDVKERPFFSYECISETQRDARKKEGEEVFKRILSGIILLVVSIFIGGAIGGIVGLYRGDWIAGATYGFLGIAKIGLGFSLVGLLIQLHNPYNRKILLQRPTNAIIKVISKKKNIQ